MSAGNQTYQRQAQVRSMTTTTTNPTTPPPPAPKTADVQAIEVHAVVGDPRLRFTAVVQGPAGTYRLDVTVDEVLDYFRLQRVILERCGLIYVHHGIAGRDGPDTACRWHNLLSVLLRHVVVGEEVAPVLN